MRPRMKSVCLQYTFKAIICIVKLNTGFCSVGEEDAQKDRLKGSSPCHVMYKKRIAFRKISTVKAKTKLSVPN